MDSTLKVITERNIDDSIMMTRQFRSKSVSISSDTEVESIARAPARVRRSVKSKLNNLDAILELQNK
ncbi:hypothetical protein GWI33_015942 [Rhynchophorus ferrugineus]|uniref:Uncharacterized protein n=1 Tax=Rhynchophorus ferrugineus TaxID=354439 RepID=A0A834M3Y2_RHYFE|nr:hypothetical protein GWI33_015942 [Rhynchophorus ferrugineus]